MFRSGVLGGFLPRMHVLRAEDQTNEVYLRQEVRAWRDVDSEA